MAVLATFDPGNDSYGRSANALFSGMNQGLSMMERKQAMALNQQRADQQRMEFIAKLPLIQAQADLTRVNAATAVKNATDIANWETNAALESTTANKEFIDAVQYNVNSDPNYVGGVTGDSSAISTPLTDAEKSKYDTQATLDARSQKLAALSAKYSYMKNLPQYEGFIGRVDKEAATAHLAAAQNLKLEELMTNAQMARDRAVYQADQGVVKEKIKATAKATSADTYTQSRERIAAIANDTKLTLQERGAKIAETKTGATISDLTSRAAEADQAAAEASAAGDEEAAATHRKIAQSYRDAVQKVSTFAGQTPGEVPKKSPSVRSPATEGAVSAEYLASDALPKSSEGAPTVEPTTPTPAETVAPTKVPKNAKTITVAGKTYQIFYDAKGRAAYQIDGHWVPLKTE